MQTGTKVPDGMSEQWSGENGFVPPWKSAVDESLRRSELKARAKWLTVFTIAFAIGCALPFALFVKLGIAAALAVVCVGYYVASARSFMKALELQQQAMSGGIRIIAPTKDEPAAKPVDVDLASPLVTQEEK